MMQRLFGVVALVVAAWVAPAQADITAPASRGVDQVIQVAEKIALNRVTQSQAAQLLGSQEAAASLWSAVKTLERQKGSSLNSMDFAAIREVIAQQNLTDTVAVVQLFTLAAQNGGVQRGQTIAQAFGQVRATAAPTYQVETAANGVEALSRYTPKTEAGRRTLAQILGDFSRGGRQRLARLAAMFVVATTVTPGTCSAASRAWCADNAPEVPVLAASLGVDQVAKGEEFVTAGLRGFPAETPNYIGSNERVVRGMIEALQMGNAMPQQLKACFFTGKPDGAVN